MHQQACHLLYNAPLLDHPTKKEEEEEEVAMGNSLRCCLACVLPCGALDVIRIVHLNGHIEEYSRPVSAADIIAANPGHMLSKPYSSGEGVAHRILIVSDESELKRGNFYFLIPSSSIPNKNNKKKKLKHKKVAIENKSVDQDKYLEDILSEKKKSSFRRKSSSRRVGIWRPRLESILEDPV